MVRQPAANFPRLPDKSTIFAAEATAISLALNYYQHMGPVNHDVVVYSDSMSCSPAIEGDDAELSSNKIFTYVLTNGCRRASQSKERSTTVQPVHCLQWRIPDDI